MATRHSTHIVSIEAPFIHFEMFVSELKLIFEKRGEIDKNFSRVCCETGFFKNNCLNFIKF